MVISETGSAQLVQPGQTDKPETLTNNGIAILPRNGPMHLWITLFLTKEARMYNGAKTASSINGAGKTGQLHVK